MLARRPAALDAQREAMPLHTVRDLQARLDAVGAPYEVLPHPRTTSAIAEAEALDVPAREVAKTVILVAAHGCVRAVVPADARVSVARVRRVLQDDSVRLAREDELRILYPEYELGAVPPLGGMRSELAILDTSLVERANIVIEGGATRSIAPALAQGSRARVRCLDR